jgi:large subunit ribosomal protein L10
MPTRAKLQDVDLLREELGQSAGLVLTEYRGLTVSQMHVLRGRIRAAGGRYRVVKNRLFKLACQGHPAEKATVGLVGPTGVAFVREPDSAVPKALLDYAAGNDKFVIKGGYLDGQALTAAQVRAWATVPPKPVLISEIVGALEAPVAGVVYAIEAVVAEVARLIDAVVAKREESAA